jgi:two-component sensor histidine kinase
MQGTDAFSCAFNFVQEPLFLLDTEGCVEVSNHAAQRMLGEAANGDIRRSLRSDPAAFCAYLRRATRSRSPLVGAATFIGADGRPVKTRTYAALFGEPAGTRSRIILRCVPSQGDEFSVLARQIASLNCEIRQRLKAEAALASALQTREAVLGELHHRVKNNTQILMGMVAAARRAAETPELVAFLNAMYRRLIAIAAVQQLLYQGGRLTTVPARPLLHHLCETLAAEYGPDTGVALNVAEVELANDLAFPLAIMLGELAAEALARGQEAAPAKLAVTLSSADSALELIVSDSAPTRGSGNGEGLESSLAMVRGLCRQTGGKLAIASNRGTRCSIRFEGGNWGKWIQ